MTRVGRAGVARWEGRVECVCSMACLLKGLWTVVRPRPSPLSPCACACAPTSMSPSREDFRACYMQLAVGMGLSYHVIEVSHFG